MDRLIRKIQQMKNPTVVGLDPTLEMIPAWIKEKHLVDLDHQDPLQAAAECLVEFNKHLIDALYDIVPAIKPQAAYYELYGFQGVWALSQTIDYAHQRGMYVITDGKRNDIGSTMDAYGKAHLGTTQVGERVVTAFGADALTVNGYLGSDGIVPLQQWCKTADKSVFVLVKTSNPSSGEIQDKLINGKPLYEQMGILCESWGKDLVGEYGYSAIGAVVGATYPAQLRELRKKLPHTFFLVPGYGAQGGRAQDIQGAFDDRGMGGIINSSRGILCAYQQQPDLDPRQFAQAARHEALKMRDQIMGVLS